MLKCVLYLQGDAAAPYLTAIAAFGPGSVMRKLIEAIPESDYAPMYKENDIPALAPVSGYTYSYPAYDAPVSDFNYVVRYMLSYPVLALYEVVRGDNVPAPVGTM